MPVNLSTITFPTPEPFDKTQPEKQRENMAFVMLQVLEAFKQQNPTIDIDIVQALTTITTAINVLSAITGDNSDLVQAVKDLKFNNVTFSYGNAKWCFDGRTLSKLTT